MQELDSLDSQRTCLANAGRLHWIHWLVVVMSLVVTLGAWRVTHNQIAERTSARFDREARNVLELVEERMRKYEDALWSGVAVVKASGGQMSHEQWLIFANSLRFETKYPGINGVGIIDRIAPTELDSYLLRHRRTRPDFHVHPEHDESEHLPITYIEPAATNAAAVGLDMAHEANRYAAARKACDSGRAQITGPIVLVQDEGRTPGFLFFVPFYRREDPNNSEARRESFSGMVYAPFVVKNLMSGTLHRERRHVAIRIVDEGEVIYDEHVEGQSDFDDAPMFTNAASLNLYGRVWNFDIRSTQSFRVAASHSQPTMILVGGLCIDAMLLAIFLLLSRSNRLALKVADGMTKRLRTNEELEGSNADLERFAYVASHDLKTPLRGIGDLVEYLEEDLEPYLNGPGANPSVRKNLERVHTQLDRMNKMIAGILDYSRIDGGESDQSELNVEALIRTLANDLNLREDQIDINCHPTLVRGGVTLEQVLTNLVTNAVKHHDDPSNASIHVKLRANDELVEFSVADNGPGIEDKYHDRIFEVFQTLRPKDETENTGIGLSIVKKIIERRGGTIAIASSEGCGTSFTVQWPIEAETQRDSILI